MTQKRVTIDPDLLALFCGGPAPECKPLTLERLKQQIDNYWKEYDKLMKEGKK